MKNSLALVLGGLLCIGGIAPSTSEAATVVIKSGGSHHRHKVWVPGHKTVRNHHRVFIPGHYVWR